VNSKRLFQGLVALLLSVLLFSCAEHSLSLSTVTTYQSLVTEDCCPLQEKSATSLQNTSSDTAPLQYRALGLAVTLVDDQVGIKQINLSSETQKLMWSFSPILCDDNGVTTFGRDLLTQGSTEDLAGSYTLEVLGEDGTTETQTLVVGPAHWDGKNLVTRKDQTLLFNTEEKHQYTLLFLQQGEIVKSEVLSVEQTDNKEPLVHHITKDSKLGADDFDQIICSTLDLQSGLHLTNIFH